MKVKVFLLNTYPAHHQRRRPKRTLQVSLPTGNHVAHRFLRWPLRLMTSITNRWSNKEVSRVTAKVTTWNAKQSQMTAVRSRKVGRRHWYVSFICCYTSLDYDESAAKHGQDQFHHHLPTYNQEAGSRRSCSMEIRTSSSWDGQEFYGLRRPSRKAEGWDHYSLGRARP